MAAPSRMSSFTSTPISTSRATVRSRLTVSSFWRDSVRQAIDFGGELFDAAQMVRGVGLLHAQRLFRFVDFRLVCFGGGARAVELLHQLRVPRLGLLQLLEQMAVMTGTDDAKPLERLFHVL